jgi:hypothetical protein
VEIDLYSVFLVARLVQPVNDEQRLLSSHHGTQRTVAGRLLAVLVLEIRVKQVDPPCIELDLVQRALNCSRCLDLATSSRPLPAHPQMRRELKC